MVVGTPSVGVRVDLSSYLSLRGGDAPPQNIPFYRNPQTRKTNLDSKKINFICFFFF